MNDLTTVELSADAEATALTGQEPGSNLDRNAVILAIIIFVIAVGGWEWIVRYFHVPAMILPTPSAIVTSLWKGVVSGVYLRHFVVTFTESIGGFGIGAAIGLLLGGIIGTSPLLERAFYPFVISLQTVPKVALVPIIIIWFGYGIGSKIAVSATIAAFPVLANTIVGLRAAPREEIDLLTAYTASRWQIFRRVQLPQALPYILVGFDVAMVLAVIGAIVGEFVGAQAGLGFLILQRNLYFDTAGEFAIIILLSGMGVALHFLISFAHRRIVFWNPRSANQASHH
jgi:NitT/TauT family transport system permease protein